MGWTASGCQGVWWVSLGSSIPGKLRCTCANLSGPRVAVLRAGKRFRGNVGSRMPPIGPASRPSEGRLRGMEPSIPEPPGSRTWVHQRVGPGPARRPGNTPTRELDPGPPGNLDPRPPGNLDPRHRAVGPSSRRHISPSAHHPTNPTSGHAIQYSAHHIVYCRLRAYPNPFEVDGSTRPRSGIRSRKGSKWTSVQKDGHPQILQEKRYNEKVTTHHLYLGR